VIWADRRQATPLHHAAFHKKPAHVKLLLEFGADIKKKNRAGNTPLDDAIAVR
jgi:ankyrin repeat protein